MHLEIVSKHTVFVTGKTDFLEEQEVKSRLGAARTLVYLLKCFDEFFARFGERLSVRGNLPHERKRNVQWISSEFQMLRQDMFWVNKRTRCMSRKETISTSYSVFGH